MSADSKAPFMVEKHPLNTSFDWQPARGPFRRISAAQAAQYNEHGFFPFHDAFDAQTMADVIAQIDPLEQQTTEFLRTRKDGTFGISRADEITFRPHLVKQSAAIRAFTLHPVFQDICHDLLGPDVRLYWDQSVYKKPEAEQEFPWHQDNGYTFVRPQQYLTCWVALTDATVENGCPWVAPGMHLQGTLKHHRSDIGLICLDQCPEAVPIPLKAGGIAVFSSLTPHRTGPNLTDGVRKSYIVQFAPDGAVMEMNGEMHTCDAPDRQFAILRAGEALID